LKIYIILSKKKKSFSYILDLKSMNKCLELGVYHGDKPI
jgi:hypothetical protein